MSAVVKLSSKLPADDETNGLDAKALRLIEEPEELLIAVVWIDTQKVVQDTDSGDQVPYARIRRIEPLGDASAVGSAVRDVVATAMKNRTGRSAMPFEQGHVSEGFDPDQRAIDDQD